MVALVVSLTRATLLLAELPAIQYFFLLLIWQVAKLVA